MNILATVSMHFCCLQCDKLNKQLPVCNTYVKYLESVMCIMYTI